MKKPLLIGILILDIIALIPSPFIYVASMMSAAGGKEINFSDPFELLIRFLWILAAHYPVFIILSYIQGRDLLKKNRQKAGTIFTMLSAVISLGLIGTLGCFILK